ncbi:2-oxo acid dehydrogenase subunit E2 [Streptomyces rimosus]|uniref:2-oxo acid dehydrogenase subunit E2 n=1 Tax=Streptomyces rimosus TaxID=1927 RepID=UPI000519AAAB|nr:2-oxo acid dehydrogenase subunit E2 [Streptomyces rimosus]
MPDRGRVARQRRHTQYFLRHARRAAPVFLDTDVDMTRVVAHRDAAAADGRRYSFTSYVLWSATRVLEHHPECNAAVGSGLVPRLLHTPEIRPKVAMDRTVDGVRSVLSASLPDLRGAGLDDIQRELTRLRETPLDELAEFRGIRALHRMPVRVGWWAFRASMARLNSRPKLMGTVAVSSLGHRAVTGFHAVGGTTLTVNIGQVRPVPIVRDGSVESAPVMRLNLCFDHRVVDGAEAADVLTEIKETLEAGPQPHHSSLPPTSADPLQEHPRP